MKIKHIFKVLIFIGLGVFIACRNNSSNDPTPSLSAGNWRVSYYYDDKDETNNYSNHTFEFKANGQFVATFSGQSVTGTWVENSSSNKFVITITGTKVLDDLADDWLITEKTATSIKLKDDNSTKIEVLHFQKN